MLSQKGVGVLKVYRTGWYSNKGGNGVGLYKENVDGYNATYSDVNGERSDEELGRDRVVFRNGLPRVIDQWDGVAFSAV